VTLISQVVETDRAKVVYIVKPGDLMNKFLVPALQETLQDTILDENLIQMRNGNDPTRVVLDSKRRSGELGQAEHNILARAAVTDSLVFRGVKRRITFFYTQIADLKIAVEYAWNALKQLMLRRTGLAFSTMYIYCKEPSAGRSARCENLGQASAFLDKATGRDVSATILGPRVEYRRMVIYSKRGGATQTLKRTKLSDAFSRRTKAVDRYKLIRRGTKVGKDGKARGEGFIATTWRPGQGSNRGGQVLLARAVQELVKTRVQRQFKDIYVGYRFTSTPEGELQLYRSPTWRPDGPNRFIPALYLGISKLGDK